LICGVGAGLCVVLANLLPFGNLFTRTVGASGAIYGLMLAFAMLYPNRQILFYIFPIPAKYFVLILFLISFYSTIAPSGSPVSHVAHLGGMVIGFAYMRLRWSQVDLMSEIRTGYKDWKLRRAKRKFNVYMSKQNRDRGNWVN
jgi:membrane associated rhomboid family serine protease